MNILLKTKKKHKDSKKISKKKRKFIIQKSGGKLETKQPNIFNSELYKIDSISDYYNLDLLENLLPLNHIYNLDYAPIIDYKTFKKESINSIDIPLRKKKKILKNKINLRKIQPTISKYQLELLKKFIEQKKTKIPSLIKTATPLHEFKIEGYPHMLPMIAGGTLQTAGSYILPNDGAVHTLLKVFDSMHDFCESRGNVLPINTVIHRFFPQATEISKLFIENIINKFNVGKSNIETRLLEDAEKITYEMDSIIESSHNENTDGGFFINKNKNQEERLRFWNNRLTPINIDSKFLNIYSEEYQESQIKNYDNYLIFKFTQSLSNIKTNIDLDYKFDDVFPKFIRGIKKAIGNFASKKILFEAAAGHDLILRHLVKNTNESSDSTYSWAYVEDFIEFETIYSDASMWDSGNSGNKKILNARPEPNNKTGDISSTLNVSDCNQTSKDSNGNKITRNINLHGLYVKSNMDDAVVSIDNDEKYLIRTGPSVAMLSNQDFNKINQEKILHKINNEEGIEILKSIDNPKKEGLFLGVNRAKQTLCHSLEYKRSGDWGQVEYCLKYNCILYTYDRLCALYAIYRNCPCIFETSTGDSYYMTLFRGKQNEKDSIIGTIHDINKEKENFNDVSKTLTMINTKLKNSSGKGILSEDGEVYDSMNIQYKVSIDGKTIYDVLSTPPYLNCKNQTGGSQIGGNIFADIGTYFASSNFTLKKWTPKCKAIPDIFKLIDNIKPPYKDNYNVYPLCIKSSSDLGENYTFLNDSLHYFYDITKSNTEHLKISLEYQDIISNFSKIRSGSLFEATQGRNKIPKNSIISYSNILENIKTWGDIQKLLENGLYLQSVEDPYDINLIYDIKTQNVKELGNISPRNKFYTTGSNSPSETFMISIREGHIEKSSISTLNNKNVNDYYVIPKEILLANKQSIGESNYFYPIFKKFPPKKARLPCVFYIKFCKIISIEKDGDIKNFITMSSNLQHTSQRKLKDMEEALELDQIIEEEILEIRESLDLNLESEKELTLNIDDLGQITIYRIPYTPYIIPPDQKQIRLIKEEESVDYEIKKDNQDMLDGIDIIPTTVDLNQHFSVENKDIIPIPSKTEDNSNEELCKIIFQIDDRKKKEKKILVKLLEELNFVSKNLKQIINNYHKTKNVFSVLLDYIKKCFNNKFLGDNITLKFLEKEEKTIDHSNNIYNLFNFNQKYFNMISSTSREDMIQNFRKKTKEIISNNISNEIEESKKNINSLIAVSGNGSLGMKNKELLNCFYNNIDDHLCETKFNKMINNIKNLSYSKHQTVKSNLYNCLGDRPEAPYPNLISQDKKVHCEKGKCDDDKESCKVHYYKYSQKKMKTHKEFILNQTKYVLGIESNNLVNLFSYLHDQFRYELISVDGEIRIKLDYLLDIIDEIIEQVKISWLMDLSIEERIKMGKKIGKKIKTPGAWISEMFPEIYKYESKKKSSIITYNLIKKTKNFTPNISDLSSEQISKIGELNGEKKEIYLKVFELEKKIKNTKKYISDEFRDYKIPGVCNKTLSERNKCNYNFGTNLNCSTSNCIYCSECVFLDFNTQYYLDKIELLNHFSSDLMITSNYPENSSHIIDLCTQFFKFYIKKPINKIKQKDWDYNDIIVMPNSFILPPTITDEKNDFFKYMLTYSTLMNNKNFKNLSIPENYSGKTKCYKNSEESQQKTDVIKLNLAKGNNLEIFSDNIHKLHFIVFKIVLAFIISIKQTLVSKPDLDISSHFKDLSHIYDIIIKRKLNEKTAETPIEDYSIMYNFMFDYYLHNVMNQNKSFDEIDIDIPFVDFSYFIIPDHLQNSDFMKIILNYNSFVENSPQSINLICSTLNFNDSNLPSRGVSTVIPYPYYFVSKMINGLFLKNNLIWSVIYPKILVLTNEDINVYRENLLHFYVPDESIITQRTKLKDILGSEDSESSMSFQLKTIRPLISKMCLTDTDYPLYNGYTVIRCLLSNIMQDRVLQINREKHLIILENVIENEFVLNELNNIFKSLDEIYLLNTSKIQTNHFIELVFNNDLYEKIRKITDKQKKVILWDLGDKRKNIDDSIANLLKYSPHLKDILELYNYSVIDKLFNNYTNFCVYKFCLDNLNEDAEKKGDFVTDFNFLETNFN